MNRNTNVENMHFTANDAKPMLCAVHLGTMIVAENTLFKVVRKYNDFVWRLKSENGEIVNVFYALSQSWSLHCTYGSGIAEGRDLEAKSFNLAQMPNRSTKD